MRLIVDAAYLGVENAWCDVGPQGTSDRMRSLLQRKAEEGGRKKEGRREEGMRSLLAS